MTSITEVRSTSTRLFASMWRPLVSVITTLYYVAIIFHRRVWYRKLSLRYACVQSSGIILIPWATFVPIFVSFATYAAELALGEKLRSQSLTHPAYLMLREPKCLRFRITLLDTPSLIHIDSPSACVLQGESISFRHRVHRLSR